MSAYVSVQEGILHICECPSKLLHRWTILTWLVCGSFDGIMHQLPPLDFFLLDFSIELLKSEFLIETHIQKRVDG